MPTLQDELQTILPAWEEEQMLIEQAKQINQPESNYGTSN